MNFAKVAAGLFAVVLGWKFAAGKKRKRKEKKLDKVKATVTKRPVNYLDAKDVEASGFAVNSKPISMRWFRLTSTPPA